MYVLKENYSDRQQFREHFQEYRKPVFAIIQIISLVEG